MQREILFRGKRLDNGEWAYGYLEKRPSAIQGPDYGGPWYIWTPPVDPDDSGGYYNVDPATAGQYTGLTDKNGKKIFEGDVLEFINEWRELNNKWKCVVEFIDGCFVCRYIEKEGHLGDYNHFGSWNAPLVKWWVIGNKWDNPELLEVKR